MIHRAPRHPALRPLVSTLWATAGGAATAGREWVLPTGSMHLAIRLGRRGLRLFESAVDPVGRTMGSAVVGGARAAPYLRDVSSAPPSLGAQLLPGAARLLFGVTAEELAGRHTDLGELWGSAAVAELQERLSAAGTLPARLELFEDLLVARLCGETRVSPLVSWAIEGIDRGRAIGELAAESGRSHRHFLALFRREVGLAPSTWCRIHRFQRAVELLGSGGPTLAEVALAAGYADQSHLNREFRALAGTTPRTYRLLGPRQANHLPVPDRSDPFKIGG